MVSLRTLSALMLRDGLGAFIDVVVEEAPVVRATTVLRGLPVDSEVTAAMPATLQGIAQTKCLGVENILAAQGAGAARSLCLLNKSAALGVGQLRHSAMLPSTAVDAVEADL